MAETSGGNAQQMKDLWAQAVGRVKQEVIAPTLWRALEKTVPVAWENNFFVVGMAIGEGQLAGQLNTGEYRGSVERTLRSITGSDVTFRVIEGTTYEDWEYSMKRDAAAVAQRHQSAVKQFKAAGAYASWDEIYEQVSRLWASSEYRALPTGRARFLDQALGMVTTAMDSLYPVDIKVDELTERGFSRVIDRVASMTNSDSAVIAYLLFERRKR